MCQQSSRRVPPVCSESDYDSSRSYIQFNTNNIVSVTWSSRHYRDVINQRSYWSVNEAQVACVPRRLNHVAQAIDHCEPCDRRFLVNGDISIHCVCSTHHNPVSLWLCLRPSRSLSLSLSLCVCVCWLLISRYVSACACVCRCLPSRKQQKWLVETISALTSNKSRQRVVYGVPRCRIYVDSSTEQT